MITIIRLHLMSYVEILELLMTHTKPGEKHTPCFKTTFFCGVILTNTDFSRTIMCENVFWFGVFTKTLALNTNFCFCPQAGINWSPSLIQAVSNLRFLLLTTGIIIFRFITHVLFSGNVYTGGLLPGFQYLEGLSWISIMQKKTPDLFRYRRF